MNAEKENFSAQESLDLIASMIVQAKGNVTRNRFYFLLWGWIIVVCNLGVYYMINFTSIEDPFIIFSLTIPGAIISAIYASRQHRAERTRTLIDNVNVAMWVCFAISCFTMAFVGSKINFQVNGVILVMAATPTFVTGLLLRFRPLMLGAIALYGFGIAILLVAREHQFLLGAIAIALGYLVPGYMLKHSK